MAQTKRKRRSKHRGTAAGRIESRGRTGRKPTPQETKRSGGSGAKLDSRQRRAARLDKPPTWRGSALRGAIATVFFFVFVIVVLRPKLLSAVAISVFMLAVYMPMGYYTDLFMYRRRQRQKQRAKEREQAAAAEAKSR